MRRLVVRGAPAIGCAAAFGLYLGVRAAPSLTEFDRRLAEVCDYLATSRPTAVNLFWAIERMKHAFSEGALAGARLVRFNLRVPRYATANPAGSTVREVVSRGKHLLMRIEPGVTLHSHLGMDGSWRLGPATRPGPGPRRHRRFPRS